MRERRGRYIYISLERESQNGCCDVSQSDKTQKCSVRTISHRARVDCHQKHPAQRKQNTRVRRVTDALEVKKQKRRHWSLSLSRAPLSSSPPKQKAEDALLPSARNLNVSANDGALAEDSISTCSGDNAEMILNVNKIHSFVYLLKIIE